MARTTIQFDETQKAEIEALLANVKNGAQRAERTALNRTLTGAVTLVSKEIGATVTLKSATIKKNISKKKATLSNLSARATLRGGLIPLIQFQNRQLKNGISVKVYKSASTTKLKHAFYATMRSGHKGIFLRREVSPNQYAARLPIDEQFGPNISTLYEKTPGLAANVEQTSADRLQRELSSQVDYLLGLNNDRPD